MLFNRLFSATFAASLVFAAAVAQTPSVPGADTAYFHTKVGSFKILGSESARPPIPPRGHLEINFTGTVLVSGLAGKPKVEGNVNLEYENKTYKKLAYYGTGKITVDGLFESIEWFGRDMSGSYRGIGNVRLFGEFDKDLHTGEWWYGSDPAKKNPWGTNLIEVVVPQPAPSRPVVPNIRPTR
jgi:hypothetical protein